MYDLSLHEYSFCRDLDKMLSELGVIPPSEVFSSLSEASDHSTNPTPDASLQPTSLSVPR